MIASAEQKRNSRGAGVHAAIHMSESFTGNAIMGFATVTHSADLSHNFMTLGKYDVLKDFFPRVNDHGAYMSAGAKSSTPEWR